MFRPRDVREPSHHASTLTFHLARLAFSLHPPSLPILFPSRTSLASVVSQSLRPKIRRSPRPLGALNARRSTSHTSCTLASQDHVSAGKDYCCTLYIRPIMPLFVRFLVFLFVLELLSSIPQVFPHRRTSSLPPRPRRPRARRRAPDYDSVVFLRFGNRHFCHRRRADLSLAGQQSHSLPPLSFSPFSSGS